MLATTPALAADASADQLKSEIDALKQTIRALEQKVNQLEAHEKAAATAAPAAAATTASAGSNAQQLGVAPSPLPHRETISGDPTAASRVDNQAPPDDPELQGFIPIPGTTTRFRLGGYAKLDAIYDFRDAGDPDQFITATIPAGEEHVDNANANLHAKQTRFSIDVRRPTPLGNLRFYLENDFFGSSTGYQFRLRHAYGQIGNTYGGYGYSAFMDADALPNTLDFEGPGGQVYLLTASVQQKFPFGDGNSFTLSLEKPEAQVMLAEDGDRALNNMPAVVGAGRWERDWGHLQLGAVVRHLGYMTADGEKDYVYGGGISASGSYAVHDNDLLLFNVAYGQGIARFVADISGSGYDAAIGSDGKLHALESTGGYLAYTHYWASAWSSNAVYGYLKLDNTHEALGDSDFSVSHYGALNLLYSPVPSWTVGAEVLYGRLELQGPDDGYATRIQTSIQYNFIK